MSGERALFERQGYLAVKGFFPAAAVESCRAFLSEALKRRVEPVFQKWGLDLFAPDCAEKAQRLLNASENLSAADRQLLLGHFPLEVRLSETMLPLAECLGESTLLQDILGSRGLFMHMPPMMRFVPPSYSPAAVPPHQDISYNQHMSSFVTVWTPLVPITERCGGLVMFEGEPHAQPVSGGDDSGWLPPVNTDGLKPKQLTGLTPGDAVILSSQVVHGSAPNLSKDVRLSMDLRVFGQGGASQKHYLDLRTMRTVAPAA